MNATPLVDIVIPVFNEEVDLEPNVRRLHAYLEDEFPFSARITIADNASRDNTWDIAQRLAAELPSVRAVGLPVPGRGRAIRHAWSTSQAEVLAFMDVDLSTDLRALLPLVAPLLSGHSDIAIGTRLAHGSRVVRGPKRELISRGYNLILHTVLGAQFSDAQCGFKAIRADAARRLLPEVEDQAWFFDTELLMRAQRHGIRIHEVPVDWVDDADSRVHIRTTAMEDLRGVWRLAGVQRPAKFAGIGVLSTIFYLALFAFLRVGASAETANLVALITSAAANTIANRRYTFGIRVRSGFWRHLGAGFLGLGMALALTDAGLRALLFLAPHPGAALEMAALIPLNLVATAARYLLLRRGMTPGSRNEPAAVIRTGFNGSPSQVT